MKATKIIFYILVVSLLSSCDINGIKKQHEMDATMANAILEELNYARKQPKEYAETVLKPKLSRFTDNKYLQDNGISLITNEGASAVEEAIGALNSQNPLQSLSLDADLSKASHLLAEYQANSGATGHSGPNGMDMKSRIEQYGKWSGGIGENCAYGSKTAREIVAQLIIDDGVSDRGHRKNIFNSSFNKVGISYIKGGNAPYGSVCVMDFAGGFVGH